MKKQDCTSKILKSSIHVVVTGLTDKEYIEISNTNDFAENTSFVVSGAFNLIQE